MKYTKIISLGLIFSFTFLMSCEDKLEVTYPGLYTDEEFEVISTSLNLPEVQDDYNIFVSPFGNQNNNNIATLGRVLFYDARLSADGTISCASCHRQDIAFSDDVAFSEGVHNNLTDRNSIALGSLLSFDAEYGGEGDEGTPGLFWDERARTVKAQMEMTIANEKEMGIDVSSLKDIVEQEPYYTILFEKAFFDKEISSEKVIEAIEAFVRSISTTNSRFDNASNQVNFFTTEDFKKDWVGFTESENRGKHLFGTNCGSCHESSLNPFGENSFHAPNVANNGLDLTYTDKGVGAVSFSSKDNGVFKIPGIKNIALTAPYMHDGRFNTLEEVVNFYNDGIQDHKNLHPNLRDDTGAIKQMNFQEQDKEDLIAFLHTLTDETMAMQKDGVIHLKNRTVC